MKNNMWKKGLVLGIILLFVGASVIPTLSGYSNKKDKESISLDNELIGYWKFDEGSGSIAYDSSGNNYDGTIQGATWTSGYSGYALEFHGNEQLDCVSLDAYVEDLAFNIDENYKVEAYFKTSENLHSGVIFSICWWDGARPALEIIIRPDGTLEFEVASDAEGPLYNITVKTGTGFNDGNWHYVKGEYFGHSSHPTIKFYVDDEYIGSDTGYIPSFIRSDFDRCKIGRAGHDDIIHNFDGVIDEVKTLRGSFAENQPPIADFTWTPDYPKEGKIITFDGSYSYDPDGTIDLYEWDFDDDGQYNDATGKYPTHSWSNAGSYPISLKVTDNDGATDSVTKMLNVGAGPQPDLTLFIEDALDSSVVWKASGDRVDVVVQVDNPTSSLLKKFELNIGVFGVLPFGSYMGKVNCFIRDDFYDITNEKDITNYCIHDENSNIFKVQANVIPDFIWSGIPPNNNQQFVFRISIPENAFSGTHRVKGTLTYQGNSKYNSKNYKVTNNAQALIITNRCVFFSKFGNNAFYYGGGSSAQVEELLNSLYDISVSDSYGYKKCIVYYVDHYDDLDVPDVDITHWDNHNDINWDHPNDVHNAIDGLIEDFISKTNPVYLMIVGGDEIIPFCRVDDSDETGDEINHPYNHDNDPILKCASYNRYLSDVYYADTDHKDAWKGEIELSVGRIIGASASDMRKFIENGIKGPKATDRAIVTAFWNPSLNPFEIDCMDTDKARNKLDNKWEIPQEHRFNFEDWTSDDIKDVLKSPFTILTMFNHGDYYKINCPGGGVIDSGSLGIYPFPDVNNYNPLFFAVACRVLPTDDNGQFWNPSEWDNLIYKAVNQGISGGFFSGGFAYYMPLAHVRRYGEKFGNEFFEHLVTSGQKTEPVGKAFKETKIDYTEFPLFWTHQDTKTMREFNYYGVPWMKIPQGSRDFTENERGSEINFTVSHPMLLPNGNYSRMIQVHVSGFNVSSFGGFDLIIINGTEQSSGSLKPIIPYANIPLLLPKDVIISGVELVENTSSYIGKYNIPCINSTSDENGAVGFSNNTDVEGYFPEQVYEIDISNFPNYQQLQLVFPIVKHNPITNDTIFNNYMMLNVTYNISNPIVIHQFNIDDYFVIGNPIQGIVTCENIGSETLSDLRLNLSVENMITGNILFSLSSPFTLEGGELTELSTVIDEVVSCGGNYFATVEIIDSEGDVLASTNSDIFISSGEIVEFDCPEISFSGENAIFNILFKNNNVCTVSATGLIRVYDSNYEQVAFLSSSLIDIPSGSSEYININWDTMGFESDRYTISAMVDTSNETFRILKKTLIMYPEMETSFLVGFISDKNETEDHVAFKSRYLFSVGLQPFTINFYHSGEEIMFSKDNQLGYIGPRFIIGFFNAAVLSDIASSTFHPIRDRIKRHVSAE